MTSGRRLLPARGGRNRWRRALKAASAYEERIVVMMSQLDQYGADGSSRMVCKLCSDVIADGCR
jgi:hypothetical protein